MCRWCVTAGGTVYILVIYKILYIMLTGPYNDNVVEYVYVRIVVMMSLNMCAIC